MDAALVMSHDVGAVRLHPNCCCYCYCYCYCYCTPPTVLRMRLPS